MMGSAYSRLRSIAVLIFAAVSAFVSAPASAAECQSDEDFASGLKASEVAERQSSLDFVPSPFFSLQAPRTHRISGKCVTEILGLEGPHIIMLSGAALSAGSKGEWDRRPKVFDRARKLYLGPMPTYVGEEFLGATEIAYRRCKGEAIGIYVGIWRGRHKSFVKAFGATADQTIADYGEILRSTASIKSIGFFPALHGYAGDLSILVQSPDGIFIEKFLLQHRGILPMSGSTAAERSVNAPCN